MNIQLYNGSIEKLNPTHILSFNYTNTYEKIYNIGCRKIEYDFIHGVAVKENADFCNMVLGIDEYLKENERQGNIEFVEITAILTKHIKVFGKDFMCFQAWQSLTVFKSKIKGVLDFFIYILCHC